MKLVKLDHQDQYWTWECCRICLGTCPVCWQGVWYSARWQRSFTRWCLGRKFSSSDTSFPSTRWWSNFLRTSRTFYQWGTKITFCLFFIKQTQRSLHLLNSNPNWNLFKAKTHFYFPPRNGCFHQFVLEEADGVFTLSPPGRSPSTPLTSCSPETWTTSTG